MNNSIPANPLETESISRLMVRFAVPAIISSLISSVYNIVDQIFIGHSIGPLGNAATNIAFPLVTVMSALSMMIGVGGASNFSLDLGKRREKDAGQVVGNSIVLGIVSGILLALAVLIFLKPLMILFGARGQVLDYSMEYTGITAIGLPFALLTSAGSQLIRADASPRYAMVSTLFGAVLNTILDPIFIFVFNMGIRGAALATITGQIISAVIVLLYFRKFKSVKLTKDCFILKPGSLKRIVSLGAAACFNQLAVTCMQIIMNNTLGHYGELSVYGRDIPLAVVGIISKVNIIFSSVTFGIAQSCQPIMGFNYGSGNFMRVREAYKKAAAAITVIGFTALFCFQVFPRQLIGVFGSGDELYYEFGIRYFRIFLFFVFFNGIQILSSSFFSSIGKAAKGILVSLSRQFLFLLPLVLILPFIFGIDGVLFSGPIADGAADMIAVIFTAHEFKLMKQMEKTQNHLS